jgi:para-aminobenzoate synthetase component 1
MLNWAQRFNIFCLLDSQAYSSPDGGTEWLLAVGSHSHIDGTSATLTELDAFLEGKEWVFGHLSYDLFEKEAAIISSPPDRHGFPPFFFFQPLVLLSLQGQELIIDAAAPDAIYESVLDTDANLPTSFPSLPVSQRLSKEKYIGKINALLGHIQQGDCYEINFCQEFFSEGAQINPLAVYQHLVQVSPTPFSAFYKLNDSYLLCASPERFLQKKGITIMAQPMKGTAKRGATPAEDAAAIHELRSSTKEQAENVMIVDLMRNDLSKICEDGTVKVRELFGVYSFPQVHQMVSTIGGELRKGVCFSAILDATFPMGSMTGAPKKRVMELIAQYESSRRGLFSGSVGYFHKGDFDFNVVIRSILYNQSTRYLSYSVGSGITIYCDPEAEWEECLLKAAAIKKVLA